MTNENPTDNQGVYPAIYDFSILPYALGDILTWNVKACIKAEQAGKKEVDVYLCADPQHPCCRHQDIGRSDYQSQLFELLQAFFCNPLLRNLHVFSDRQSLGQKLPEANDAFEQELARHPSNQEARNFKQGLELSLRQRGLTP